jgi:hypothetical protein
MGNYEVPGRQNPDFAAARPGSVQALERGVGIRIFDRTGGTVRTTAGGALFLARARQLIAQGSGAFCTLSYSDKEPALLRCRWSRHEGTQADTIIKVVKSKLPH